METDHGHASPSSHQSARAKGVGESADGRGPGRHCHAVVDALWPIGCAPHRHPHHPAKVWKLCARRASPSEGRARTWLTSWSRWRRAPARGRGVRAGHGLRCEAPTSAKPGREGASFARTERAGLGRRAPAPSPRVSEPPALRDGPAATDRPLRRGRRIPGRAQASRIRNGCHSGGR